MTTAEIVLLLTNLGTIARWWFDRRDARSALTLGKEKADEAVATLTAALVVKNEEMDEDKDDWQQERRQLHERIAHLESIVYGRMESR